jgi:hypothetical protein
MVFHHASCPTTGAKPSAFAAKGDQTILLARGTLDPDEPVLQMAASQKVVEFLFYMSLDVMHFDVWHGDCC